MQTLNPVQSLSTVHETALVPPSAQPARPLATKIAMINRIRFI
jgi:hypothetical protein